MPGITLVEGMSLQLPAGAISLSPDANGQIPAIDVTDLRVRLDLWPTWLEIGCIHADEAARASALLRADMSGAERGETLMAELRGGIVALVAFAFAMEGFCDVVKHELGAHPHAEIWKENRTPQHRQIAETLKLRLKLRGQFNGQLSVFVKELMGFRNRAAHPSSRYMTPNYRPDLDSAVHPHFLTFSAAHVIQARALALTFFDLLLQHAAKALPAGQDDGWIQRGRTEIDRLMPIYRVPGDDRVAYPTSGPRG